MTAPYFVEWLSPRALPRALRLARSSARSAAAWSAELKREYQSAQADFSDLSVGLYRGSQLVGCVFARAQSSGPRPVVRVLHVAVRPRHRRAFSTLALRFVSAVRARQQLSDAPLQWDASADDEGRWTSRPHFLARLGYRIAASPPSGAVEAEPLARGVSRASPTLAQALRQATDYGSGSDAERVGRIETVRDWQLLEPWWNDLLAATSGGTVFQSYEYQRAWWAHLGWSDSLFIIVVMRAGVPIAIAPFEISWLRSVGFSAHRLGFIGTAPESDRPRMLVAPADAAHCADLVADYILEHHTQWHRIGFAEQQLDLPLVASLIRKLGARGYFVRHPAGPESPVVAISGNWQTFLAGKSKNVRKSLKRKDAALAERGVCRYESVVDASGGAALARYLEVERASWKAGTAIASARASADLAFYRDLAARFAALGKFEVRFLALDSQTIAATFGLVWNRCYYSLHIAHDERFDDYSPGVVLTAREIEDSFAHGRYDTFDFLSGVLPNKGSWATAVTPSVDVHIIRPDLGGRLFCFVSFHAKPLAKRLAARYGLMPYILRLKAWLKRSELDPE